jgi:ATP-dependent exoDNAse (exonuclease V) alpha subunit
MPLLSDAVDAGAKVVLVGDPQQLQAIEAGAAFRSIHERHGGAEIGEVCGQREDWQRDATLERYFEQIVDPTIADFEANVRSVPDG